MAQAQTQVVILDSSTQDDILVCGVCKLVFNSLQLFIDHKNFHCLNQDSLLESNVTQIQNNTTNYFSNNVSTSFCNNIEKQYVNISETQNNNISCSVCKRKFKRLKCLYAHLKLHESPSQCQVCGRCFENSSHLKRHIATHKVWPDGLNETTPKSSDVELLSYSCSYCDAVLSNYSQFRAHLNTHLSLKKFKCIQHECNVFYETVEDLLQHVSYVHNEATYICHICRKVFPTLDEIALHHQNHNESNQVTNDTQMHQFKCSQCDAIFRKPEKLSLHLLTESHNKTCIHCKKAFTSDKRLRTHLHIHNKSKPFQCSVCSKNFHLKKYLTSHMLKHGDRQFACKICKNSFKRQDVLQRHMRTHTQTKKFKCPFKDVNNCSKEFTRKDKVREHLKSHAKKLKSSSIKQKMITDMDTVEICIVPLEIENGTVEKIIESRQFRVTDQVYLNIHNEDGYLGRVVIGLFGDLAPKAVKNFKVLATKGINGKSYKGTKFNRIIKRFMIQGGDVVSDDGYGSISIYGETFEDENLDVQHSMAGFVSMANKGKDSNGCQFIITTRGTPWLDGLHTIIGKVVEGQNTVHVVEHTPTDGEDRPTRRVYIADCGLVPTPQPYYISDDPYDLWSWIKASAVPLTMSFSILGFFHWMMKKMEI